MKDDLSPKKDMKIRYFLQIFWKDGLFIKVALEFKFYLDFQSRDKKMYFQKSQLRRKADHNFTSIRRKTISGTYNYI